jgi:hypothetical protein
VAEVLSSLVAKRVTSCSDFFLTDVCYPFTNYFLDA